MRGSAPILAALLAAGCGRQLCASPRSDDPPGAADANGDGAVDVTDGLLVERWLFAGGAAPACEAAVDASADGLIDAGDGTAIWAYAFAGGSFPEPAADACGAGEPDDAPCARVDLDIAVDGATATVRLRSRELAIEAWQLSLRADCAVLGGEIPGPEGRTPGYARVEPVQGGVVVVGVLDWIAPAALAADGDWHAVLELALEDPGGCALELSDGLQGAGQPVRNLVSAGGRSYPLL